MAKNNCFHGVALSLLSTLSAPSTTEQGWLGLNPHQPPECPKSLSAKIILQPGKFYRRLFQSRSTSREALRTWTSGTKTLSPQPYMFRAVKSKASTTVFTGPFLALHVYWGASSLNPKLEKRPGSKAWSEAPGTRSPGSLHKHWHTKGKQKVAL